MEQTFSQSKHSTLSRNIFMVVGTLLLLGLFAVMAVHLDKLTSADLQGRRAPDFSLTPFDQFGEEQITSTNLRGQVVVLNFWASWCVECYKEAGLLEQAWKNYKDRGVVFLGVDYLDTDKEALAYMKKYGITYPSGPDEGTKIAKAFAITGVPETIFIDRDGNIVHVKIGPIEEAELYDLLDRLISQPAQGS